MSSDGNRSQPNSVRTGGKQDGGPENSNRSDITDRAQADSKSPCGKTPAIGSDSHQASRDHNKHNNPGQSGHKLQQHSPAEEKR
ncbi:hypothetical protein [Microvirga massiliensis]|uniref:hypothetical protein n=1 Tax=Microvirga massiliensis TaxID=1033741 RepID=UPI00062B381C|nr:hypothetical protein [Microvirga massiliensis]